jgi:hypothetical protein
MARAGRPARSSSVGATSMPRATVFATCAAGTPGPARMKGTRSVAS